MSVDIALPKTVLLSAVIAALLVSPRHASAETYTVIGAPGVDPARVSSVDGAVRATGRASVVVTTSAGAGAAADPADATSITVVTDAIKAIAVSFAELDYDRVIAVLERAETDHLLSLLATPEGRVVLVELNVWLGASLVGAGRSAEGEERYAQVLALDSGYDMDPDYWAEEYTRSFQLVRDRPAPAVGSLTVETNPDGASISIDGVARDDSTPATIKAAAGLHYLYITRPGHRPWAQRLNVAAGEVKRIPVALSRDDELTGAALGAAMASYAESPTKAVRAVVELTGRDDTIVVTAGGLVLHDRTGGVRGSASGGDARQQVDALFPGVGPPPAGGDDKPWYRRTWFLASSAAVIVVAGSIGVWAITREGELRGQFVRP